ncbi:MAG: YhcH/YjgK/YiaL family protein, partial [Anaerolinea sp.]|nr:YhcH/YjgK/YiaL family protein [Anaerolinea sp.]
RAFSFLLSNDLASLEPGRMEIEGESLYVLVQQYISKPETSGKWEAHKRYIDVQYLVSGSERVGYSAITKMTLGDYNPQKDFQALSGTGQILQLNAGSFMVFFPQDAHMPGLANGYETSIKKIVVKCAI